MKSYDFRPTDMKIIERHELSNDVIAFRLAIPKGKPFSFVPGQFVMLSVLGFGEIPIGITTSPQESGYLEVAIRAVGGVSRKICALGVGDKIGVGGPFGNGFPLNKIAGKDVVLVAGGIGLFPLRSLIRHIGRDKRLVKSLTILTGARCPDDLVYRKEYNEWRRFAKLHLTVDKCDAKWKDPIGNVGVLFDLADVPKGSVMIAVGPPVMYRAVISRYAGKRISEKDLYFDLERRMKCGIGKCQHCTCGKEYVCLDGPVFSYSEIKYNWEAF